MTGAVSLGLEGRGVFVELGIDRGSLGPVVSMAHHHHYSVVHFAGLANVLPAYASRCTTTLAMSRVINYEVCR